MASVLGEFSGLNGSSFWFDGYVASNDAYNGYAEKLDQLNFMSVKNGSANMSALNPKAEYCITVNNKNHTSAWEYSVVDCTAESAYYLCYRVPKNCSATG